MEIERKFIIDIPPEGLDGYRHAELRQCYLSLGDGETPERRIRSMTADGAESFFLTEKGEGLLSREENEREITREEYDALLGKAVTAAIEKTRYYIPIDSHHTAELDVFCGSLSGLMTAEVEFASIEDAERFTPPSWFGREITEDKRYKNKALALFGMPTP